jgi:ribulose-5-phosphate 4-epimerase/fuculose-1-phosphate aldolase
MIDQELEQKLQRLCEVGASFYRRGYAHGSTGNLSVRVGDRVFVTPTGKSLEGLTPELLAEIDLDGRVHNRNQPSKEAPFHLGLYRARPEARAIVHLHATYSVAVSCLDDFDEAAPFPPITPYFFMRVAPLGVVPYHRPGSEALARAVEATAGAHHCLLLRNHGSICSGTSLSEAVDRAEELEATARLTLLLHGRSLRGLTPADLEELERVFRK